MERLSLEPGDLPFEEGQQIEVFYPETQDVESVFEKHGRGGHYGGGSGRSPDPHSRRYEDTVMGPDGWRYPDGTPVLAERAAADALGEAQSHVARASAALGVVRGVMDLNRRHRRL